MLKVRAKASHGEQEKVRDDIHNMQTMQKTQNMQKMQNMQDMQNMQRELGLYRDDIMGVTRLRGRSLENPTQKI